MSCQNYIMPFGKYKGKDLLFIAENNPKYLLWLESECELKGNLKDAVWQFVKTQYFKDCLNEYISGEESYYEAMTDSDGWMWK